MKSRLSRICFMFICLGLLISFRTPTYAWENRLARTPPMFWCSWEYTTHITEALIIQVVDGMASNGMQAAGYTYINIDDGWQTDQLNADGSMQADPVKFPHGMKWLADYVHSKGFKFGIYSSPGVTTCAGGPWPAPYVPEKAYKGAYGHEQANANQFAAWGVDYLKYDQCSFTGDAKKAYTLMRDCIIRAGRPMVYEICNYGMDSVWTWGESIGNLWRTAGDNKGIAGYDKLITLSQYAGPGHWNHPDSNDGGKVAFSIHCILAAPLAIAYGWGAEAIATATNKDAIAIDQDSLGIAGVRVNKVDVGILDVIAKPLIKGCVAVLLYNRGTTAQTITANWSDIGLTPGTSMKVLDIWEKLDKGTMSGSYTANVPAKDVVMIKLTPVSAPADQTITVTVINGRGE